MNTKDIWHWLGPLARAWNAEDKLYEQRAVLLWPALGLAPLARALYVDRGVLHLAVGSHVAASELNLLKAGIVARLSDVAPESGVIGLRFHIRAVTAPPLRIAVRPPTPADVQRVQRELPPGVSPRLRHVTASLVAWARARDEAILNTGGWRCAECGLALVREKRECPICKIDRLGLRH